MDRTIERWLIRTLHLVEKSIPRFRVDYLGRLRVMGTTRAVRHDLAISADQPDKLLFSKCARRVYRDASYPPDSEKLLICNLLGGRRCRR